MNFYCLGFYGVPNFGDEILCRNLVDFLYTEYKDSKVTVVTHSIDVSKNYADLHCDLMEGYWPKLKYYKNMITHFHNIKHTDLIIVGGGGLISDYYDWTSVLRYFIDVLYGILINKPYVFVGLGVTNVRYNLLKKFTKYIINNSRQIYVRDENSSYEIKKICNYDKLIKVAPDLSLLNIDNIKHTNKNYSDKSSYVLFNLREKPYIDLDELNYILQYFLIQQVKIIFLCSETDDTIYYEKIIEQLDEKFIPYMSVINPASLAETYKYIYNANLVVAERLHINIVAKILERPTITLNYEEKVKNIISSIDPNSIIINLEELRNIEKLKNIKPTKLDFSIFIERSRELLKETIDTWSNEEKYYTKKVQIQSFVYLTTVLPLGLMGNLTMKIYYYIRNLVNGTKHKI